MALFLDDGAYAIARWGVEQFRAKGGDVYIFRHHDPEALLAQIKLHAKEKEAKKHKEEKHKELGKHKEEKQEED